MTNHDIIVAKVFKAKYFLSVDFLDAQLGHNPSFVWRSIHASWVVVKEGLQWRIGNGNGNLNLDSTLAQKWYQSLCLS